MSQKRTIPLGAPVFPVPKDPDEWVAAHRAKGYRAAYCPLPLDAPEDRIRAFREAAERAGLRISEVGAWSNPISPDDATRKAAVQKCIDALALADRIGAGCAVNIAGSRGEKWDGPSAENFTPETFELIVETTRAIIDAVKPKRSFFTLETMPWCPPHSPDSYLALIRAIDRREFAVHLDPVNMINSVDRYYNNGAFILECFEKLGPWIKNCHGKDILLRENLTVHLDEVRPGLGVLDYGVFLAELARLDEVPLMLEHLSSESDYDAAAAHVRSVGRPLGLLE